MSSKVIPNIEEIMVPSLSDSLLVQRRFRKFQTDVIPGGLTSIEAAYDVFVVHPRSNQIWDLSAFVVEIGYSYDYVTPFTKLDIVFANTTNVLRFLKPGYWVVWYGPFFNNFGIKTRYTEIDRGIITEVHAAVGDEKSVSIIAKDPAWMLSKNVIPLRLPEGTLTDRLRFLAGRNLLSLEEPLRDTEYVLPSTRGGTVSVWEDIYFDIAETNKKLDRKYVLRHRKGEFTIWDTELQSHMWAFEIGSNIFRALRNSSIEDYYNIINVLTSESNPLEQFGLTSSDIHLDVAATALNEDDIGFYGQHILTVPEELTTNTPSAQIQADNLLKKHNKIQEVIQLQTYSITGLRWGDKVLVYEPTLNIAGIYHVASGQHTINSAGAVMILHLELDSVAPDRIRDAALDDLSSLFGGVDLSGVNFDDLDLEGDE